MNNKKESDSEIRCSDAINKFMDGLKVDKVYKMKWTDIFRNKFITSEKVDIFKKAVAELNKDPDKYRIVYNFDDLILGVINIWWSKDDIVIDNGESLRFSKYKFTDQ